ncbi:hypothetical protein ACFQ6B_23410 [Streptomyces wedmorensis]|uniref:Uncharacterized protein n=1 Tax=Streptomyces wedmorensis TaxID=43759 RepID=A0ABW6IUB7_STRWE
MGDAKRKSRWWIWLAVGLTAVCGLPVALMAWAAYSFSEAGRPQAVDCADAMEFARGRLPVDAEDARCTGTHWQDSYITVDFRMPRTGVADWLDATYPGAVPDTPCDEDLCREIDYGQSLYVHVKVVYEDGGTALVHLTSFDV